MEGMDLMITLLGVFLGLSVLLAVGFLIWKFRRELGLGFLMKKRKAAPRKRPPPIINDADNDADDVDFEDAGDSALDVDSPAHSTAASASNAKHEITRKPSKPVQRSPEQNKSISHKSAKKEGIRDKDLISKGELFASEEEKAYILKLRRQEVIAKGARSMTVEEINAHAMAVQIEESAKARAKASAQKRVSKLFSVGKKKTRASMAAAKLENAVRVEVYAWQPTAKEREEKEKPEAKAEKEKKDETEKAELGIVDVSPLALAPVSGPNQLSMQPPIYSGHGMAQWLDEYPDSPILSPSGAPMSPSTIAPGSPSPTSPGIGRSSSPVSPAMGGWMTPAARMRSFVSKRWGNERDRGWGWGNNGRSGLPGPGGPSNPNTPGPGRNGGWWPSWSRRGSWMNRGTGRAQSGRHDRRELSEGEYATSDTIFQPWSQQQSQYMMNQGGRGRGRGRNTRGPLAHHGQHYGGGRGHVPPTPGQWTPGGYHNQGAGYGREVDREGSEGRGHLRSHDSYNDRHNRRSGVFAPGDSTPFGGGSPRPEPYAREPWTNRHGPPVSTPGYDRQRYAYDPWSPGRASPRSLNYSPDSPNSGPGAWGNGRTVNDYQSSHNMPVEPRKLDNGGPGGYGHGSVRGDTVAFGHTSADDWQHTGSKSHNHNNAMKQPEDDVDLIEEHERNQQHVVAIVEIPQDSVADVVDIPDDPLALAPIELGTVQETKHRPAALQLDIPPTATSSHHNGSRGQNTVEEPDSCKSADSSTSRSADFRRSRDLHLTIPLSSNPDPPQQAAAPLPVPKPSVKSDLPLPPGIDIAMPAAVSKAKRAGLGGARALSTGSDAIHAIPLPAVSVVSLQERTGPGPVHLEEPSEGPVHSKQNSDSDEDSIVAASRAAAFALVGDAAGHVHGSHGGVATTGARCRKNLKKRPSLSMSVSGQSTTDDHGEPQVSITASQNVGRPSAQAGEAFSPFGRSQPGNNSSDGSPTQQTADQWHASDTDDDDSERVQQIEFDIDDDPRTSTKSETSSSFAPVPAEGGVVWKFHRPTNSNAKDSRHDSTRSSEQAKTVNLKRRADAAATRRQEAENNQWMEDCGMAPDESIDLQHDGTFFAALPTGMASRLLNHTRSIRLGKGDVLFEQGDSTASSASMYFIKDGEVKLTRKDHATGREKVLTRLTSGQHIGELSLLFGTPRTVTATACTEVSLSILPSSALDKVAESKQLLLMARTPSLASLPRKDQLRIASSMGIVAFQSGDTVVDSKFNDGRKYIVLRGHAVISSRAPDGNEMAYGKMARGAVFSEGTIRRHKVSAVGPLVCAVLPKVVFDRACIETSLGHALARTLSHEAAQDAEKIAADGLVDVDSEAVVGTNNAAPVTNQDPFGNVAGIRPGVFMPPATASSEVLPLAPPATTNQLPTPVKTIPLGRVKVVSDLDDVVLVRDTGCGEGLNVEMC